MIALFWLISGSFALMFTLPAFLFTYLSLEPPVAQPRSAALSKGKGFTEAGVRGCVSLAQRATS
jgi:hypothetical protein